MLSPLKRSIELIKSGCNLKKILESKPTSKNNSVQELPKNDVQELPKDIAQKEIEIEDLGKEIEELNIEEPNKEIVINEPKNDEDITKIKSNEPEINHDEMGISDVELEKILGDIKFEGQKKSGDTTTEPLIIPAIEELINTEIVDNETKNEVPDNEVPNDQVSENEVSDNEIKYFELEYNDYNIDFDVDVDVDAEVESEGEIEYYDVNEEFPQEEENPELRADSGDYLEEYDSELKDEIDRPQSNLWQLIQTETLPSDSIEIRDVPGDASILDNTEKDPLNMENRHSEIEMIESDKENSDFSDLTENSDPSAVKTLSSEDNSSASTEESEDLDFEILGQDIESPKPMQKLVEELDADEKKFLFHLPPEMLEPVMEQFKHQTKASRTEFINEYRRLNPPVPPVQKEMIDSIHQA